MKTPLIILFLLISAKMYAPGYNSLIIERSEGVDPFARLLRATAIIESGNNHLAYNAQERATGLLQIRPIRLLDYNQRTGSHYTMNDLYDPKISKKIWLFYARKFSVYDFEGISRSWNCNSRAYWMKIKKEL